MAKVIIVTSAIIGAGLGILAMFGGLDFGSALVGGLVIGIFTIALGFFSWGIFMVLGYLGGKAKSVGGFLWPGIAAFFVLFWNQILPVVCVEVICHALGIKN